MKRQVIEGGCPRRSESPMLSEEFAKRKDVWESDGTCSWCGGANPALVMEAVRRGHVVLGPTDKSYKVYLEWGAGHGPLKAYFQHFSGEQKREFVDLYNRREVRDYAEDMTFTVSREGAMKISYPGYFYTSPFFMAPASQVPSE